MNQTHVSAALRATLMAGLLVLLAESAQAQERFAPARIAIMSAEQILRQSNAGAAFNEGLNSVLKNIQQMRQETVAQIVNEEKQLGVERSLLSQEAFQKKVTQLVEKRQRLAQQDQQISQQIEAQRQRFTVFMLDVISKVATEYGQEINVDMVLDVTNRAVLLSESYNITAEVLQRVNQKVPKLPEAYQFNPDLINAGAGSG